MKTDKVLELMRRAGLEPTVENYLIANYSPDPVPDPVPSEALAEAERALGIDPEGDTSDDEQQPDRAGGSDRPGTRTDTAKPAGRPVVRPVVRPVSAGGRGGGRAGLYGNAG